MLTSVYIHIPFCLRRCNYCDFNTYADRNDLINIYVETLCKEIKSFVPINDQKPIVHTIYLGGGTPSLLSEDNIKKVLGAVQSKFSLYIDHEISMEVNPGTVNEDYIKQIKKLGINRLSIGMQSSNPQDLTILGRIHSTYEVIETVKWARMAGLKNINLDLIFGIPGQDLKRWQNTLEFALQLNPEHLSLYSLTLEDGTPLKSWYGMGLIAKLDDDITADMYELAGNILDKCGYQQYEISNWARNDLGKRSFLCKHNLQYWHYEPYVGFGLGAHSYYGNHRFINIQDFQTYLSSMDNINTQDPRLTNATNETIIIDRQREIEEMMIMGLRLTQSGISDKRFRKRFGTSVFDEYPDEIRTLVSQELIEPVNMNNPVVRLTKKGRFLGNHVFRMFLRH